MSRTISIAKFATAEKDKYIEVAVVYDKGGPSLSGEVTKRGYYLHATPKTVRDGMVFVSLFSGCKTLIKETSKFSMKELQILASETPQATIDTLVAAIPK